MSVEVLDAIIEDWKLKYPFNDEHVQVYDKGELSFEPVNPITDYGYYKLENVPSVVSSFEDINPDTGEVTLTLDKPEALPDTIFIALNTLAC